MRTSPFSWSNTLTKLGLRRNRRKAKRHAAYRRRPVIENLESRNLLSLTVNTAEDENDGYDVGGKSLREAIAKAATISGVDTIEIDPSLTGKTTELSLGQITIDSDVSIEGLGASALTIHGQNSSRVFNIAPGVEATISGLTITGGVAPTGQSGGAIVHQGESLSLLSVIIEGNSANYGGGIGIISTANVLTVQDSIIRNNESIYDPSISVTTGRGGAIYANLTSGATILIERSRISENRAEGSGGGMYVLNNDASADISIVDSTFDRNFSEGEGGGAYQLGGDIRITNSSFTRNTTDTSITEERRGGGLFLNGNNGASPITASITNSTFAENVATRGGGIFVGAAVNATIIHSTVADNTAAHPNGSPGVGGGVSNSGGTLTLFNSIVADNRADDVSQNNIHGTALGGQNLTSGDPLLSVLGNYGGPTETMVPLPGSPAIDAGNNAEAINAGLVSDQRGFNRFVDIPSVPGSTVDFGAVEWHSPVAIGDFDGDGRDDEAFIGFGTALYVASNPGGKLSISKWADIATTAVGGWQVGDFNGDDRDDVAYRTNSANAWYIAFSESNRFVVAPTNISGHVWPNVLVGDFDGDGTDELVGSYDMGGLSSTDVWEILDFHESAGFSRYNLGTGLSSLGLVHAGDVDGDGLDDLVARDGGSWMMARTSIVDGRATVPGTAANIGNWFNGWVTNLGQPSESVDVEGPYRKLLEIFSEVYNTIELELYPGFMKGLTAAAQTRAANPWEQAALLVDQIEQAGFTPDDVQIASGDIEAPIALLEEWLGIESKLSVYGCDRTRQPFSSWA